MSGERERHSERLTTPEQYYNDPRVVEAILVSLGGSGDTWSSSETVRHAYLGVGTAEKAFDPTKKSPVKTILPGEVGKWINSYKGKVELFASFLMKESQNRPDKPTCAFFVWDIDRFHMIPDGHAGHNYDEGGPISTPEKTFTAMEPVLETYKEAFDGLNIPVLVTMTGKGLHFMTQVTNPDTIDEIIKIGGPVEDTLAAKLRTADKITKNPKPIPESFQQVHVGAGRLQQFLNMAVIKSLRSKLSPYYDVEIFNKAFPEREVNGIALDNTATTLPAYHKLISSLGSLYFIRGLKAGIQIPRSIIQLPLIGSGFQSDWRDLLPIRYSFGKAAEYLGSVDCHIPDAGKMRKLISAYQQSPLQRLHKALDATMGDSPQDFNTGYRRNNYRDILSRTSEPHILTNVVDYAPSFLGGSGLQLYYFDKLVVQVFEAMGGSAKNLSVAPHVAGFIRAILEDPKKNWGEKWMGKEDAALYARKMTEQILGQYFESPTNLQ